MGLSGPALLGLRTNWGSMVGVSDMVTCPRISRGTGEVNASCPARFMTDQVELVWVEGFPGLKPGNAVRR